MTNVQSVYQRGLGGPVAGPNQRGTKRVAVIGAGACGLCNAKYLLQAGFAVPHWPKPWGLDASAIRQLVIDEELAAARVRRRHLQVAGWVLPTIVAHGTAAARRTSGNLEAYARDHPLHYPFSTFQIELPLLSFPGPA